MPAMLIFHSAKPVKNSLINSTESCVFKFEIWLAIRAKTIMLFA